MPATIRHWTSASPVMLAGHGEAIVARPPRLVRKPWAPAYRTWFSITSWMAAVDVALLLRQLLVGRRPRPAERAHAVDGAVQRLADERRGQAGRQLGQRRGGWRPVPLVAMPRSYVPPDGRR